jgi:hypothetical protein
MEDKVIFRSEADFPTIHDLVEVWSRGDVTAVKVDSHTINLLRTETNEPWTALTTGDVIVRDVGGLEGFHIDRDE